MSAPVNCKRCFLTFVSVFVAVTAVDMILNGTVLSGQYQAFASLWRPEARMKTLFPLVFVGNAVFAYFFTWIYAKGFEPEKPHLAQGLRFALLIWPLSAVACNLSSAPFINVPLRFFAFWMAVGLADSLAAGLVAGLVYKPKT
jgi:hypothetical protein